MTTTLVRQRQLPLTAAITPRLNRISTTTSTSDRVSPAPKCFNSGKTLHTCAKTRRIVLQGSGLLLLLSTTFCGSKRPAFGEEDKTLTDSNRPAFAEEDKTLTDNASLLSAKGLEPVTCDDLKITKSVYFDVAIDGEAAGRIVIGLYGDDVPAGASRFAELAAGKRGVGYRRKEFVKITPSYIQNAGIRSYGVDTEIANGRLLADELVEEGVGLEKRCKGSKTFEGAVGLIIRDPSKPPSQIKLVAKGGKLEVEEEEVKPDPNGTEFVITTKRALELEPSTVLVGKVVDGMDVVTRIANVKVVQENTKSPYFQVAKLIGDKRAIVAERGFNRPYSKIVITKCGEL